MKMNINMKKIVFFLLVQFVTLGHLLKRRRLKAEVAYTKDYGKAIELYEGLLKTHGESAEIYYNLGNAYYKGEQDCPGHLELPEQALLLDPGDGDIRFNLLAASEVCRQDRAGGRFLPAPLVRQGSEHGAADSWAQIGIVCFIPFLSAV